MKWRTVVVLSILVFSVEPPSATACPLCESETGAQVQAGIFNEQFWMNVTLTLLPLLVLLGIVGFIYFDLSWLWKRPEAQSKDDPDISLEGKPTHG